MQCLRNSLPLEFAGSHQQHQVNEIFHSAVDAVSRERVRMEFLSELLLLRNHLDQRTANTGKTKPVSALDDLHGLHYRIADPSVQMKSRENRAVHHRFHG